MMEEIDLIMADVQVILSVGDPHPPDQIQIQMCTEGFHEGGVSTFQK